MPRLTPYPRIVRGVPRPCDCSPRQGHGTIHTYQVHGCGCDTCRDGARTFRKVGDMLHARGQQRRRAADPVRRRIELLKERGYTVREVADLAGVSFTTLHFILRSGQPTVTERVHASVMSVRVPSRKQVA